MLHHLDRDQPLPKKTVLKALQSLVEAWIDESKTAIVNCFRKANISVSAPVIVANDEDDSFNELNADLEELRLRELSLAPEDMTAEILKARGDNVVTTAPSLTDEEILEEAIIEEIEADDGLYVELDEEEALFQM